MLAKQAAGTDIGTRGQGWDDVAFRRKKRILTRLLIVEDEPLVAFATEHLLTDEGYLVVATVDEAGAAMAVLDDGPAVDLVLADVALSSGSGIDVAAHAHALGVPVMFVTGNCPIEAHGFARGCLAKPYHARDLISAIAAIEAVMQGATPRRIPAGFALFEPA